MNWKAVDLCCGLGGWTEGLMAEGYDVVGYDIESHEYGDEKYPGTLVLQDILTLHGSQFADVDLIIASPPCQEYSYMAMPWSLAKAKRRLILADETGAERARLNQLFDACFRIQREASEAAGWHIPLVVENVRGAQEWVGKAVARFGAYYLWGDIPLPLPADVSTGIKQGGDWFNASQPSISRLCGSKSKARKAASARIAKIPLVLSRHVARAFRW